MKILRFAVISLFILFGLLVLPGTFIKAYGAGIPIYLGEFCWEDPGGGIARLGLTHMGDGHFLVNGTHTETPDIVQAVNGNAEIVGTQLIMHITSSGSDASEARAFFGTIVLDLATLDGTVEGLGVYYEKPMGPSGINYDGVQTLTFVSCP